MGRPPPLALTLALVAVLLACAPTVVQVSERINGDLRPALKHAPCRFRRALFLTHCVGFCLALGQAHASETEVDAETAAETRSAGTGGGQGHTPLASMAAASAAAHASLEHQLKAAHRLVVKATKQHAHAHAAARRAAAARPPVSLHSSAFCLGWRNTKNCSPDGGREHRLDKTCDAAVESGASGYCLCAHGVRAAESTCAPRKALTCRAECKKAAQYRRSWRMRPETPVDPDQVPFCIGWRNTKNCRADGPREPALDLTCFDPVPAHRSGYVARPLVLWNPSAG
jgi:hypothetical protein